MQLVTDSDIGPISSLDRASVELIQDGLNEDRQKLKI